jgi:hypothetical protein
MSTDHRLDSAWFGAGAAIKQRGLEQALSMLDSVKINFIHGKLDLSNAF